jgi:hypothetical protein
LKKPRRVRCVGLVAVAIAGLLSGCYYYPYGYNPWGYPYPYSAGYPGAPNPYPPAPGTALQYPQQPAPGTALQYPQQPAPGAALQYPQQPAPGAALQYPQQPAAEPPQPLDTPVQRTPLPLAPLPQ